MRLRLAYTLTFPDGTENLRLPLRLEVHENVFCIENLDETGLRAAAYVECPVDANELYVRVGEEPIEGGEPLRGIEVAERLRLSDFLTAMVSVLSFVVDIPIRESRGRSSLERLIAESEEDRVKLESLGTSRVFRQSRVSFSVRSFAPASLTGDALEKLLEREAGVALYRQALLLKEPIGVFREFWKILESAFGAQDEKLVEKLGNYQPAVQMRFSMGELKGLLALRGRASHAKSRSGIEEYHKVREQIAEKLPRLKCLVEQVIVTKKTWGTPTTDVERFAGISAYIMEDGTPEIMGNAE